MDHAEIKRFEGVEKEKRWLKQAVADLTLDKQSLQELSEGRWRGRCDGVRRWA
jgi:hypothetical protein